MVSDFSMGVSSGKGGSSGSSGSMSPQSAAMAPGKRHPPAALLDPEFAHAASCCQRRISRRSAWEVRSAEHPRTCGDAPAGRRPPFTVVDRHADNPRPRSAHLPRLHVARYRVMCEISDHQVRVRVVRFGRVGKARVQSRPGRHPPNVQQRP